MSVRYFLKASLVDSSGRMFWNTQELYMYRKSSCVDPLKTATAVGSSSSSSSSWLDVLSDSHPGASISNRLGKNTEDRTNQGTDHDFGLFPGEYGKYSAHVV